MTYIRENGVKNILKKVLKFAWDHKEAALPFVKMIAPALLSETRVHDPKKPFFEIKKNYMRHLNRAIKALNAITDEIPGEKVEIKALEKEFCRVNNISSRLVPINL